VAILPDGRTTGSVTARDPSSGGASGTTVVLVDTGSELSALADHALLAALAHARWGPLITFHVAGASVPTVVANGLIFEIRVESHAGVVVRTATSTIGVPIHSVPAGTSPFTAFDGLLGIDLLDSIQADPVKDRALTRSYLAERV
jgi:hypothetical protein